jgi:hypothetical protein
MSQMRNSIRAFPPARQRSHRSGLDPQNQADGYSVQRDGDRVRLFTRNGHYWSAAIRASSRRRWPCARQARRQRDKMIAARYDKSQASVLNFYDVVAFHARRYEARLDEVFLLTPR